MPKIVCGCRSCGNKGKPRTVSDSYIDLAKSVNICGMPLDKCGECDADLFIKGYDIYQLHDNGELELIRPPNSELERIARNVTKGFNTSRKLILSRAEDPNDRENVIYFMENMRGSLAHAIGLINELPEKQAE